MEDTAVTRDPKSASAMPLRLLAVALLLGCLHYDLGQREQAETARRAAYHAGLQAGHGEIVAWSYELAAWFALTEARYHDVVAYARAGQAHAGLTNAMVQLVLQQARGQARLGAHDDPVASGVRGDGTQDSRSRLLADHARTRSAASPSRR